jgi:hypothetical protein
MNKLRLTIKMLVIATFVLAFASLAQAQATRTWVSGVGDDANPCSRTAPCKTFAGAISKTADCGEIDCLDPGGFGAVTITKSITLDGTGTLGSILASGTTGIIVNAPADKVITVRGLSINGACTGIRGINFIQGAVLNVEDCVIFRFTNEGILVNDPDGMRLNIRNTVVRDNTGDGLSLASGVNNGTKYTLANVSLTGNGNGLHVKSGAHGTANYCVFSNNTSKGIFADSATAASGAVAAVWNSQISMNGSHGVQSGNVGNAGSSEVDLAQNQIDRNTNGNGVLISGGGAVNTFGNNSVTGNNINGCPGCAPIGPGN